MTANEIIQLSAVIVILALCVLWLIRRIRRRKYCAACSSTTCPLRNRKL